MKKPDFTQGKTSDHFETIWSVGEGMNKRLKAVEKDMKILPVIKSNQRWHSLLLLCIFGAIVGQYFGLG